MTIGQHLSSDDQREIMYTFQRCPEFIKKGKLFLVDLIDNQEVEQNQQVFFNPKVLPIDMIRKLVMALAKKMMCYCYQEELRSSREMMKSESTVFFKKHHPRP